MTNFAYFGAKSKMISEIIEFIEDGATGCHTFVDAYGGSGDVTLNVDRDLFCHRIINELDLRLFLIHEALSHDEMAYELWSLVEDSEPSRECFLKAKSVWEPYREQRKALSSLMRQATEASDFARQKEEWKSIIPSERIVQLAASALLAYKLSFNGLGKQPRPYKATNAYTQHYNWIDVTLERVIAQMQGVEAYCCNALTLIKHFKHDPGVFIYIDPPYELAARTAGTYDEDMTDEEQQQLLDTIMDAKSSILLSGYKSHGRSIYDRLVESGNWSCELLVEDIIKSSSIQGTSKPRADEWVWYNF